jgi:glycosyltransferase involved in cell wall biosynthesis
MEHGRKKKRIDPPREGDRRPRHAGSRSLLHGSAGSDAGPSDGEPPPIPGGSAVILIPVFNDWTSLALLLPKLDASLAGGGLTAEVLIVDDGSTIEPGDVGVRASFVALRRIDVLSLRRNLGHQRAIAIGLGYLDDCIRPPAVVVMDGDGEDDPADVPRLLGRLHELGGGTIVFAERTRRSESQTFRIFYSLYKILHRALTGQGVRVGNFSAIPRRRLASLSVVSELWNHYAAAVFRSRQPYCMIPTQRGRRLCGRSSMNFTALVMHGLSAISVHSDVVGVRLLMLTMLLALFALGGISATIIVRLTTDLVIPGWATYSVGLSLILLVQAVMAAFNFIFAILGGRQGTTFLPSRDYSFFVADLRTLHGSGRVATPLPVPEMAGTVLI